MQDTNGEYVETLHSSLRVHEETHGYKVKRRLGIPVHPEKAKKSLTSFKSVRAGFSPAHELTLRKTCIPLIQFATCIYLADCPIEIYFGASISYWNKFYNHSLLLRCRRP